MASRLAGLAHLSFFERWDSTSPSRLELYRRRYGVENPRTDSDSASPHQAKQSAERLGLLVFPDTAPLLFEFLSGQSRRVSLNKFRPSDPSEFVLGLRRAGLATSRLAGIGYDWRAGGWSESGDLSVNYMLVAVRR